MAALERVLAVPELTHIIVKLMYPFPSAARRNAISTKLLRVNKAFYAAFAPYVYHTIPNHKFNRLGYLQRLAVTLAQRPDLASLIRNATLDTSHLSLNVLQQLPCISHLTLKADYTDGYKWLETPTSLLNPIASASLRHLEITMDRSPGFPHGGLNRCLSKVVNLDSLILTVDCQYRLSEIVETVGQSVRSLNLGFAYKLADAAALWWETLFTHMSSLIHFKSRTVVTSALLLSLPKTLQTLEMSLVPYEMYFHMLDILLEPTRLPMVRKLPQLRLIPFHSFPHPKNSHLLAAGLDIGQMEERLAAVLGGLERRSSYVHNDAAWESFRKYAMLQTKEAKGSEQ